jgi:hypothetical protein
MKHKMAYREPGQGFQRFRLGLRKISYRDEKNDLDALHCYGKMPGVDVEWGYVN